MTKELSKQLCELCGVEPDFPLLRRINQFKHIEIIVDEQRLIDDKLTYPDLGKPNNFVKLLELLNNQAFSTDNFGFSYQESFVKQYLDRFVFEMRCCEIDFSDVKQAIKNTEWEY